jgi:predicted TIM-barrel fold metal-dependent hydrolase
VKNMTPGKKGHPMMSRRDVLAGAAAVGVARLLRRTAAAQPGPEPTSRTPVNFAVPPGACDCHTHVIGDPVRFPMAASRTYTPAQASVEQLKTLHRDLHTARVVLVQPSVYGTDNGCTLDAMRQIGPSARGIAVVDDKTPDDALDAMEGAGIRGLRINLATAGQTDPAVARGRFDAAVRRIGSRKWHIQMYATLPVISAIHAAVATSPVPVVFDHFGGAQAAGGVGQEGFDALVELVRLGRAYVKVSAPYRGSSLAPAYSDMAPLAKALIAANPRRILWGTDWPHPDTRVLPGRSATDVAPHLDIDDGLALNQLASWAAGALLKTVLVDNPAELYRF